MEKSYGVHITHCCKWHGCKYGDPDCPVVVGIVKQEYLCERCNEDLEDEEYLIKRLNDLKEIKQFIKERKRQQI